jgi:hypothetical protein
MSSIKAVQAMGRVIRSSPGKKYGIVTVVQHGDDTDDAWHCINDIVEQLLKQGVPVSGILTDVTGRGKEEETVEDLNKDLKRRIADYDIQWQHSMIIQDLLSSGDPLDIL